MKTPQEITYETGRHALDQQHAFVAGIRQSTSTLLAAHALVASFLGAAVIRKDGLHGWAWVALAALIVSLALAAVLLAPWKLDFAVDARGLYKRLSEQSGVEADEQSLNWVLAAGAAYQELRSRNARRVRWLSGLSALLSTLIVVQALAWILGLIE